MNLCLFYPEMILLVSAVICLMWPRRQNSFFAKVNPLFIALIGIFISALWVMYADGNTGVMKALFITDSLTFFCRILILLCTGLTLLNGFRYVHQEEIRSFCCLLLCAALGSMVISGTQDFILLFIGLEIISISLSLLIGYQKKAPYGSEEAIKFFIMSACASAIMVFGISFIYAYAGTTNGVILQGIEKIPHAPAVLLTVGFLFVLVGIALKLGVVPFHAWIPDTFEATSPLLTGFLSTAPVVGIMAVLIRMVSACNNYLDYHITVIVVILAVATISFGNLAALFQKSLIRLLAYSTIAHVGYMLVGIIIGIPRGVEAVLVYLMAYILMNIGIFTMVEVLRGKATLFRVEDCAGLAKRSLISAFLFSVFLLSLIGMPLTAGFIGKFYICAAAFETHHIGLSVAVVINIVISAYYYLHIVHQIFFVSPTSEASISIPKTAGFTVVICGIGILIIGFFPELFITIARYTVRILL